MRNVREAVGRRCDLLIGTHGQMSATVAIRLAKRLEQFDPLWFEEPVPPENRAEMAVVARGTSIPVATGERLATKYEYADLLSRQAGRTHEQYRKHYKDRRDCGGPRCCRNRCRRALRAKPST